MTKTLCNSVRKAGQDLTDQPKTKSNAMNKFRQKAAHVSVNTKTEFISPKREGGNNRINIELNNSQTFHKNRIVHDQFWRFFQALVYKSLTNM